MRRSHACLWRCLRGQHAPWAGRKTVWVEDLGQGEGVWDFSVWGLLFLGLRGLRSVVYRCLLAKPAVGFTCPSGEVEIDMVQGTEVKP